MSYDELAATYQTIIDFLEATPSSMQNIPTLIQFLKEKGFKGVDDEQIKQYTNIG